MCVDLTNCDGNCSECRKGDDVMADDYEETTIDGWTCRHYYPGQEWSYREARRGNTDFTASSDGLEVEERSLGYQGGTGRYVITANVAMWLMQAIRPDSDPTLPQRGEGETGSLGRELLRMLETWSRIAAEVEHDSGRHMKARDVAHAYRSCLSDLYDMSKRLGVELPLPQPPEVK